MVVTWGDLKGQKKAEKRGAKLAIQWAAMDLMKVVHLVSSLVEQSVEK